MSVNVEPWVYCPASMQRIGDETIVLPERYTSRIWTKTPAGTFVAPMTIDKIDLEKNPSGDAMAALIAARIEEATAALKFAVQSHQTKLVTS
jgi:hypothetical protein